jgi:RimJ/RimL family protein N-acetyltransferase
MITMHRDDFQALSFLQKAEVYPDRATFMGVVFVRNAIIIAAAGIDYAYTGIDAFMARADATVNVAGKFWSRRSLTMFFDWVFGELGLKRLTAQILETNHASLKMCQGVGFIIEGVRRLAGPNDENIIMLGCLASECEYRSEK